MLLRGIPQPKRVLVYVRASSQRIYNVWKPLQHLQVHALVGRNHGCYNCKDSLVLRIVTGGLPKQSMRGCGPLLLYLFIDIIL